jgi:short-subunit dehydrogenase
MKLLENFHFDFNQSRVLVTGAGKGIGREIASMLHRFNAQVVALSRTEKDLQKLREEIECETIVAELGDPDVARRAAEQAECEDIASVVCFLLTEGAAMLNGLALRIDGGFLAT